MMSYDTKVCPQREEDGANYGDSTTSAALSNKAIVFRSCFDKSRHVSVRDLCFVRCRAATTTYGCTSPEAFLGNEMDLSINVQNIV